MIINYKNLLDDQIKRIENSKISNSVIEFIREINEDEGYRLKDLKIKSDQGKT